MLSATMPTKVAAHHSMASMMRSIAWRRGPARGLAASFMARVRSDARLVLRDRAAQRFHHPLRVDAGLRRAIGPRRLGGRDRLAPGIELLRRELVRLVP